jgi:hypothetical protein
MEIAIGAAIGALVGWLISIPIFSPKGGRMVRPGVIEYDPARGDVPPGGCRKMLGNLAFIVLFAAIGAAIGAAVG